VAEEGTGVNPLGTGKLSRHV